MQLVEPSEPECAGIGHALSAAAMGVGAWGEALERLGQACGGWGVHVAELDATGATTLNLTGGISDDMLAEFEARGGTSLGANPRANAIRTSPRGSIITEPHFISRREMERSAFYQDYYFPIDAPFSISGSDPTMISGIRAAVVSRTSRQGEPSDRDQRMFRSLVPHLWSALRLQETLNQRAVAAAAWSWEAAGAAVAVVNREGAIRALTGPAEAILRGGHGVSISRGRLAAHGCYKPRLDAMIAEACDARPWHAPPERVTNIGGGGDMHWRLRVRSLPADMLGMIGPGLALIVVERAEARSRNLLTTAEITD